MCLVAKMVYRENTHSNNIYYFYLSFITYTFITRLAQIHQHNITLADKHTPGACPTKHISIEFEIRWKFRML